MAKSQTNCSSDNGPAGLEVAPPSMFHGHNFNDVRKPPGRDYSTATGQSRVIQAYCAMTTEYGIPSDLVRKSTASLQIKISSPQLNFSNRNIIIF